MAEPAPRLAAALSDRYRIERELGQGGMATVYLAEDLKHERQVAIKVLREDLSATLGAGRFLREIKIAAQLQHPHILPLLDSGEADGFLYFVMPYIKGQSLREKLAREGELPVPEAVRLISEVVDALVEAHAHGVVHRDIKPDNVMLSGRHALVTDFGVAKALAESQRPEALPKDRSAVTTLGVAVGTPAYMSPEQAAADPHVDHRSDIYSVGVMAYEMLSGRPPFTGNTPQQVLAAHVTEAPDPVSKRRPAIPAALEQVVMRCLAKRPADRFQTASELHAALEPINTVSAVTTPLESRRISRSGRRLLPLGALALAVVAGVAWWRTFHQSAGHPLAESTREQLTSTGNAFAPAISGDGKRLAYATRQCLHDQCSDDIVVQELGGAGSATVVRGAFRVWSITWTGDDRYLLFDGGYGTRRFGTFSVPALGGSTPVFLDSAATVWGAADTVVGSVHEAVGDSVGWFPLITIADGITRDSVSIHASGRAWLYGPVLLAGGQFAAVRASSMVQIIDSSGAKRDSVRYWAMLLISDRSGAKRDSLPLPLQFVQPAGLTPDRQRLLFWMYSSNVSEYTLVGYRVDRSGHTSKTADTLVGHIPGRTETAPALSANGQIAYATGARETTLMAYTLSANSDMAVTRTQVLTRTTGDLAASPFFQAGVSPDGKGVAFQRSIPGDTTGLSQYFLMPFDSGAAVPIGRPGRFGRLEWSSNGGGIVTTLHTPEGQGTLLEMDPADGTAQSLELGVMGQQAWDILPGGGVVLIDRRKNNVSVRGVPGRRDTVFHVDSHLGFFGPSDVAPDGHSIVWHTQHGDSIVVWRMSLATGVQLRLSALAVHSPSNLEQPFGMADGSILIQLEDNPSVLGWYRIPAGGGPAVRVRSAPAYPAEYSFSRDGRHVLALVPNTHTDIYRIKNSGLGPNR